MKHIKLIAYDQQHDMIDCLYEYTHYKKISMAHKTHANIETFEMETHEGGNNTDVIPDASINNRSEGEQVGVYDYIIQ